MSAVHFDDTLFPLVITHFPDDLTFEDVVDCNRSVAVYVARKQPFVLVNDYGNAKLTLDMQRHTDVQIKGDLENNRRYCLGVVAVTSSALTRTIGKTFATLRKPPFPIIFCADMDAACDEARRLLRQRQRVVVAQGVAASL